MKAMKKPLVDGYCRNGAGELILYRAYEEDGCFENVGFGGEAERRCYRELYDDGTCLSVAVIVKVYHKGAHSPSERCLRYQMVWGKTMRDDVRWLATFGF